MKRREHRAGTGARSSRSALGIIVEGKTEYFALPKLSTLVPGCPPMKPFNLGGIGEDITAIGIANQALKPAKAYLDSGRKVVVCVDRENRDDCPGDFASAILAALKAQLKKNGYENPDVHVVIANRSFEAWILADASGLHARRVFQVRPSFHCFEGRPGERGKLTKFLGRDYEKTSDGPSLFARVDFAEARKYRNGNLGSKSLDKLLRTLGV